MTSHDDDAPDDPQLKSLRAIWLQMPDEDPPERGLAQLMAAARVKADEMAKPSWWQRTVDLLRRPPVLALASVMVLVGGAVFITQRSDKLESKSPVGEQQELADRHAGSSVAPPASEPAAVVETAPPAEPELPLEVADPEPTKVTRRPSAEDKNRVERKREAPRANTATGEGYVGAAGPEGGIKRDATTVKDEEDKRTDSMAFDAVTKSATTSPKSEAKIGSQTADGRETVVVTAEKSTSPAPPRAPELVIHIPTAGDCKVSGKSVSEAQLDAILRAAYGRDPHTSVVLRPDKGVPHTRVVQLMERAKQLGLKRFAIGATAY